MAQQTVGRANRPFKLLRQNSIDVFSDGSLTVQLNAWREEILKHKLLPVVYP